MKYFALCLPCSGDIDLDDITVTAKNQGPALTIEVEVKNQNNWNCPMFCMKTVQKVMCF